MNRKGRWFWITLFVLGVLLIAGLATGWNIVLIRETEAAPWIGVTLGTLGFVAVLGGLVLFFVKLLREMRLNQLQSEFLAAVSHELKTPIATMELTASLLRAGESGTREGGSGDGDATEARRLWDSHDAELARLKEQVNTLLEAARWQAHEAKPRKSPLVLESWIDQSLPRWRQILGPFGTIERAGDALPCSALLDPRLLNLIMESLLDNARKFARGNPRVLIRSHLLEPARPWRPSRWRIEVQDHGWGFDPADSGRIFQRFFRARSRAPHPVPGTGLGLYLAASAGKALGIKLSGESLGPGHGAVFALTGERIDG